MSNHEHAPAAVEDRKEHPFLYNWNRRLRHLHGISLRNLNLTPPASRARGKTITDDDYNLKTPTKVLAQKEINGLHHARSYDDLPKTALQVPDSIKHAATSNEKFGDKSRRPGIGRRRSTLHWSSADPRARQLKLEDVESARMVSSWFSLHHKDMNKPIYISEVMDNSMNPTFTFFDLDHIPSPILRSDEVLLKVWSKRERMPEYQLLVELRANFRSLQFVGRSLEHFHHPLPENCVLLHLEDGLYTSFTDLPARETALPPMTQAMKSVTPLPGSSFENLMKLCDLDDVIQDAIEARTRFEAEINAILSDEEHHNRASNIISTQRETTKSAKRARSAERKHLEQLRKSKDEMQASLTKRRELMSRAQAHKMSNEENLEMLQSTTTRIHGKLESIEQGSSGQVRRIASSLSQIYPIEPVKNRALQFTIRGIHLPNSVFDDTNRDEIAAALGFTAQFVHYLSLYLSIPLPYPIKTNGSESSIRDDISAALVQRDYPLHPASVGYKFEYGVFLLNKNIEFLVNRSGLRIMDIRQTLPNLKYLLFVLTAGTGDLPSRKMGGIRGLLWGRGPSSMSRRGSEDSIHSSAGSILSNGMAGASEKVSASEELLENALRAKGMPYRKSMLRDT